MADGATIDTDLEGSISPPRDNGEIIFALPWERRVFGVTLALCRSRACAWESFRAQLIARIAEDQERPYWTSWAAALEDVLADTAALQRAELDARQQAFLARAPDHDHHH
jgi:nitrile hydratase accessory protein